MTVHTPGDVLKQRYRLEEVLGRGGFAVTWRAHDLQSGQAVAVKELSIRAVEQWRAIELFEREARVLRNLRHPRIPEYVDFIAPDVGSAGADAFVLVQELAPGRSLADLVRSGWRPTEAEARELARQVLETLDYLHALSPPVVHRDLKPQNLLRDDEGQVMLVDFGSVRDTLATESELGSVAGTFGYMAPEQFSGRALPASDLYGLGATLVHVLSHRAPAELPQRELRLDFRPFVNVSEPFARFLERLLEPAPERRFASARAAIEALDAPADRALRPGRDAPSAVLPYRGSRVSVQPRGDSLHLKAGNGAVRGFGGVFQLVFAVAWLAFVGFWTSTAIRMGAPIIFPLFSIPFWAVGGFLLWRGFHGLLGTTYLTLSPSGLLLERRLAGLRMKRIEAALDDILEITATGQGTVELFSRTQHVRLVELPKAEGLEVTVRLQAHLDGLRSGSRVEAARPELGPAA